jgi:ribonuclease HI/uncharacterized phage-like protein YoqJ
MLAMLASAITTSEILNTRAEGCRTRGSVKLATAKNPTCTVDKIPASPRPMPNRSAISGIRNGVAENMNVTADAAANRGAGAPRENAVSERIGANTAAMIACQDRTVTRTRVYTDGACSGNPGPGGWAWIVPDGPFAAGAADPTTNQRMELTAVLQAVRSLEGPLEIISDSTYVVNCFRDRWWEGWLKRGWTNSQRKPVANRDLWEPLVELYQRRNLVFRWVKAHAGDHWNDLADRLAVEAATSQESRTGKKTPHEFGPVDTPQVRRAASSEDLPAGHFLLVVGHRPPELGGYGSTPMSEAVRRRLVDVIAAKRSLHPDLHVLTAMNLGTETMAAEAAEEVAVPYVAVLAYPEFDAAWTPDSQQAFRRLATAAERVITLQKRPPDNRQQAGAAAKRRDAWLRRHAHEAVAVWNGDEGPIGTQVRALRDDLGEEQVWTIDPHELVG